MSIKQRFYFHNFFSPKYHTNDPRAFGGFSNVSLKCHKLNLHHSHCSQHYLPSPHNSSLSFGHTVAFAAQSSKCSHNPPHKTNKVSSNTSAPRTQYQLRSCLAFVTVKNATTKSNLRRKVALSLSNRSEPITKGSQDRSSRWHCPHSGTDKALTIVL